MSKPVDPAANAQELRETAAALAELTRDPAVFEEAVAAFRARDTSRFQAALDRAGIPEHCRRVCHFLCHKHCMALCLRFCPDQPKGPIDTKEMLGFAKAVAPILRDDDWLYGGKIDDIYTSVTGGRQGVMTPHKGVLSDQQISDVAQYVKAMSEEGKDKADADAAVAAGKKVFMESDCTACHGTDAKGMQAMGSANLTDKVWRFDGSLEGIKRTITYGVNAGPDARIAVMPSFKAAGKLSDAEIKKLAVYVYKFGGGQADAPVTK